MARSPKRLAVALGVAVGLLVLIGLAALLLVDINRHKPRLERAASEVLGMDVRFGGRLGVGVFPGLHLSVEDGRILGEQGATVASAKRVRVWIELLPLLHRELRLRKVELTQPWLSVERDSGGGFNVEKLKLTTLLGALNGASLSLVHGTVLYADRRSGSGFRATDLDLSVRRMRLAGATGPRPLKGLSLQGDLTCGEIRAKNLSVSALHVSAAGKDGVLRLEPIAMRIFGGPLSGHVRADFSSSIPECQVQCSLPSFRIEEFLATLSPKKAAEGTMDFSASLSTHGETLSQMIRTAEGAMSLRGENLVLEGNDLDGVLSRFESSQGFNLVDVGAVFFAGPLGLAVTKGYNFGSLFEGPGGSTRIRTLVSEWRVDHGVAQAKDVALATIQNRIALRGGLDFVNGTFADVTVAAVDAKGCVRVRQALRGSFGNPVVEKPRVLNSLAGPVLKLYRRARGLFPDRPCEVFYSGSVAAPK